MRVRVEFTIRILPEHVRNARKLATAVTSDELRDFIRFEAGDYMRQYFENNGVPVEIMTEKA